VLLGAVGVIYLRADAAAFPVSVRLVLATLGAAFGVTGAYAIWLRTGRALDTLAWSQLVIDQLLWTVMVWLTGGPLSGATTFYGLSCVVAAITLGGTGALAAAAIGGVLFVGLTLGLGARWLALPSDQPALLLTPHELVYPSLLTLLGLLVVATLSASLARRLQSETGRAEIASERAERAERLAALGRVATALAHEIRNPLGSISGSIDLIAEAPGLGDEERMLCRIIRHETDRLNDLVSDMMNLARPRAPIIESVDLAQVAEDVTRLARRSGRGGADVPIAYDGPESLVVLADASQLRQVLWNLVRNAVQASEPGSPVIVRAARNAEGVEVSVIDRGEGIPESMRERIFDAFVTNRAQGVGIGLAVVKQIVDAHHALIRVGDGDDGRGTAISVTFTALPASLRP
jgi:signal transduction histidine kinase